MLERLRVLKDKDDSLPDHAFAEISNKKPRRNQRRI